MFSQNLEHTLTSYATALRGDRLAPKPRTENAASPATSSAHRERSSAEDPRFALASQALRNFLLLLRAHRLYDPAHPRVLDSLDEAYDTLRCVANDLNGLEVRVERGGLVLPQLNEGHLPDARGELYALASDLQRARIHTVFFSSQFHVGELDTLSQLIRDTLLRSEESVRGIATDGWAARLREQRVEGIQINTLTERKVDSVLASLIAALVAYGGNAPQ
jgi:hypothetical protein